VGVAYEPDEYLSNMADNTVKLTIDGKEVAAPKGMNLIEAAFRPSRGRRG